VCTSENFQWCEELCFAILRGRCLLLIPRQGKHKSLPIQSVLYGGGADSNKCSEGLCFDHFYVQSLCNPLNEDYSQIFYIIGKGVILSIHCKMSLRQPKSMRKVNGVSLIFIDFYVPVLTPHLSSNITSLLLSENITLFAVCVMYKSVISKET
jgi:hypothetical protein